MANYNTLEEAIAAGETNMTVTRNNSYNDDSTVARSTGIDWFYFNGVKVDTLYVNGNSWYGFGVSSEQLKINRRDCWVNYEYSETGIIKEKIKFFKYRWKGFSWYGHTGSYYIQNHDIFLFSNGQIYLNFYAVPRSDCNGTKALVCGSETVSYSVTAGTACEYTFIPSNISAGTGWSVKSGKPELALYETSGDAIFAFPEIKNISTVSTSSISWGENVPDGTSVSVYSKLDTTNWVQCTNGGTIQSIVSGRSYKSNTLFIKVSLLSDDTVKTPRVSNMRITIRDGSDDSYLIVTLPAGNVNCIQNAYGKATIIFDASQHMYGAGGQVIAFKRTFQVPSTMTRKPNQAFSEHVDLSNISANSKLTKVTYHNAYEDEHIELDISASGSMMLTNRIYAYEDEHIEVSVSATSTLGLTNRIYAYEDEHIEFSVSATSRLTHKDYA